MRSPRLSTHFLLTGLLLMVGLQGPLSAHRLIGTDGMPRKHWVRYPFEFQLCGIGLGDKALDRDPENFVYRYCLFRVHGNPTAVVVGSGGLTAAQTPPGGAEEGGGEESGGEEGYTGGGEEEGGGGTTAISVGGPAPAWALAAWVAVDENHCEWLYQRDTYTMGFVVDRLGFIDQIVVAGTKCDIAATQLGDPQHAVRLGDDTQRVLLRYGYPDDIETYVSGGGGGGGAVGGPGGGGEGGGEEGGGGMEEEEYSGEEGGGMVGGGGGGQQAAPGVTYGGGGGTAGQLGGAVSFLGVTNQLRRTFIFYYHDSYNVMFTLREHKVVRINIFGDPDHFNPERRAYYRNTF